MVNERGILMGPRSGVVCLVTGNLCQASVESFTYVEYLIDLEFDSEI